MLTVSPLWCKVVCDVCVFVIIRYLVALGLHTSENPLYCFLPWLLHLHANCIMWPFKSSLHLKFFMGCMCVCVRINHSGTNLQGEYTFNHVFETSEWLWYNGPVLGIRSDNYLLSQFELTWSLRGITPNFPLRGPHFCCCVNSCVIFLHLVLGQWVSLVADGKEGDFIEWLSRSVSGPDLSCN